ncbi:MAG: cytochrome c biogenesis protein CcsA [Verrucomicrobiota bacterium]|nr:cytochrome c biogenesis protein CcsA [Verrucomicrobiota bacterium]
MIPIHFFILGGLFYAGAFVAALFNSQRERTWLKHFQNALIVAGFLSQTLALALRGKESHRCPVGDTFEMLQFISWSLVVIYAVVGSVFRGSVLGLFTSGLATLLGCTGLVLNMFLGVPESVRTPAPLLVEVHASLAFFCYGVFAMLALTSVMYLLQNWSLRHKRWRGLFGLLPSLAQLELFNTRLLYTGTAVFSVAMLMGSYYWHQYPDSLTTLKLASTLAVWLAYLAASGMRIGAKLHGIRLAWSGAILFLAAIFALYAVESNRMHSQALKNPAHLQR